MGNKLNFLMIVADQLRPDALSCMGKGRATTPNIDKIAANGICFENAFTPLPVCAPARQAMLSGINPDSSGAFWNYSFFKAASLVPNGYWPEKLSQSGYRCSFLGKWGVSNEYGPDALGYSEVVDLAKYADMIQNKYPRREEFGWFGGTSKLPAADSESHWLASLVAREIKANSSADTPWHIRVDFTDPHLPCNVSEPFASMYNPAEVVLWEGFGDTLKGKPYIQKQQLLNWGLERMTEDDWRVIIARYLGMVSQLDAAVGIILDSLVDEKQLNNTIIVFTSDHGDMCGSRGMLDKHYVLYDDVVKVPLIISGPGILKGIKRKELVSSALDLPATIGELFKLTIPATHGHSLVPLLQNNSDYLPRKYINASSNGQQFGFYNQRMLRSERYKYIWNMTDIDEFYDLRNDPGEKLNLIYDKKYFNIISEMRKELLNILKIQGDLFLKDNWLYSQLSENRKL